MATWKKYGHLYTDEFLKAIPKTDLHLHLDGSLRLETLIELAKEQGVDLPADTPEGLKEQVFKPKYKDLNDYLRGFALTCSVLRTPEALERVAYELACDCFDENVYYIEPRFAPQLHAGGAEEGAMSIHDVILAVDKGLARAKKEYNDRREANMEKLTEGGMVPPPVYDYGIIVCAMRFFLPVFSKYFAHFWEVHSYEPPARLHGLASMALVTAAVNIRDKENVPIVALDIAGAEHSFPAEEHKEAYTFAHNNFLNKTVHAGEAFGPESISQAVRYLSAERIGHGTHLFDDKLITKEVEDPARYCAQLADFVADRRILLEVCLTSNLQTMPELEFDCSRHPFQKMLEKKLSVTLCTDNRLVSRTTVFEEYRLACDTFEMTPKALREVAVNGFKRAFYYGGYMAKRKLVRSVLNYYDALSKKFAIEPEAADE